MSEQLAFTLAAAAVGLVSSAFLCVGNASNSVDKITLQSTMFWDFSEPVARALATQRAQYVTGGLLLLVAFSLQVVAALASSTQPAKLPESLQYWPYFMFIVLAPTAAVAWLFCLGLDRFTVSRVLHRHEQALALQSTPEAQHAPRSEA